MGASSPNLQTDALDVGKTTCARASKDCRVVPVGKRRDGGTRYWCIVHKADATAKYGRPAGHCRAAHILPIAASETLVLDLDSYKGGIAIWGAVPPVYDSTPLPLDRGIHVHARRSNGAEKEVDETYRLVKLIGGRASENGIEISEIDAIYFMVSATFDIHMRHIRCLYCGHSHLDKDWFSVHPHQRHLCAGCGKYFRDSVPAVGNPIRQAQADLGITPRKPKISEETLNLRQRDFRGGIRIWGSNPAIVWTSDNNEEEGVHLHAFDAIGNPPALDDTYARVTIDGVDLDPQMVRTLMAQSALPHLEGRVVCLACENCQSSNFDLGNLSFTPRVKHSCSKCGSRLLPRGRTRKLISNPLVKVLDTLALGAPSPIQKHSIGLLPEPG